MRIPKSVNAAWDWAEAHAGAVAVLVVMAIVAVGLLWQPVLAAFALGLAGGGLAVHLRLTKRISRLRRDLDEVLRENGKLRHRNTVLTSGVITNEAVMTQKLPSIPDIPDLPEDAEAVRTQQMPPAPEPSEEPEPEAVQTQQLPPAPEIEEAAKAVREPRRPSPNGDALTTTPEPPGENETLRTQLLPPVPGVVEGDALTTTPEERR